MSLSKRRVVIASFRSMMKRSREEYAAAARSVCARTCERAECFARRMPPEIWWTHIMPLTRTPGLVRSLLAMTCREAHEIFRVGREAHLRGLLVVDLSILAGPDWRGVSKWALGRLSVSPVWTLDAIVTMDAIAFLPLFCNLFNGIFDLYKQRKTRFFYDVRPKLGHLSPLDVAAAAPRFAERVINQLHDWKYPRLFEDATLLPSVTSGNLAVPEWVTDTIGLFGFFDLHAISSAVDDESSAFFEEMGRHGRPEFLNRIIELFHKRPSPLIEIVEYIASMIESVLDNAVIGGNMDMIKHLLPKTHGDNALILDAISASQKEALEYIWGWHQAHPAIHIGFFDVDAAAKAVMTAGNVHIAAFVHANIAPFEDSSLLTLALTNGHLELVEWMIENTRVSLTDAEPGLYNLWAFDPICAFWLVKRGAPFYFSDIAHSLAASCLWLADALHDRFISQSRFLSADRSVDGSEFYRITSEISPECGWYWGFERRVPFPADAVARWMRRPGLHPGCINILYSIFGPAITAPETEKEQQLRKLVELRRF